MELRHLRAFVTVAEELNFRRAAAARAHRPRCRGAVGLALAWRAGDPNPALHALLEVLDEVRGACEAHVPGGLTVPR